MSAPYCLSAPGLVRLQDAATTGNGNRLILEGKCARVTFVLQSNGTTSGGAITLEEAYFDPNGPDYAGTWSVITTAIDASTFTGGQQRVVHTAVSSFWAVRARISSTITGGGSVTIWAWGN